MSRRIEKGRCPAGDVPSLESVLRDLLSASAERDYGRDGMWPVKKLAPVNHRGTEVKRVKVGFFYSATYAAMPRPAALYNRRKWQLIGKSQRCGSAML